MSAAHDDHLRIEHVHRIRNADCQVRSGFLKQEAIDLTGALDTLKGLSSREGLQAAAPTART